MWAELKGEARRERRENEKSRAEKERVRRVVNLHSIIYSLSLCYQLLFIIGHFAVDAWAPRQGMLCHQSEIIKQAFEDVFI